MQPMHASNYYAIIAFKRRLAPFLSIVQLFRDFGEVLSTLLSDPAVETRLEPTLNIQARIRPVTATLADCKEEIVIAQQAIQCTGRVASTTDAKCPTCREKVAW